MYDMSYAEFTNEQVIKMLEGNRTIDFEYELMNNEEKVITTLDNVECSISFNSEAEIMGTASIRFRETEIRSYYTDLRIRPWFKIQAPDRTWIRHPLGIYIITTPTRQDGGGEVYIDADCYDKSIILQEDKLTDRLLIKAESLYVNEVRNVHMSAGINKTNIDGSELRTSVDLEYEIGTSKLDVINSLLQAINYTPIHFDRMGNAVAKKYIEPDERAAEYGYMTDDNSLILSGANQSNDLYNVPNIVIRYVENPDVENTSLRSEYVNNDASSPLSIQRRGRKIVNVESVDDIADQGTLDAFTRRVAIEMSQVNDNVVLPTALMPHHEYRNCIYLRNDNLGITSKYIEYAWSMKLGIGEKMNHTLKKVMRI